MPRTAREQHLTDLGRDLDAVLARNSAFPTIDALVDDMRKGYKPTIRCDLDPDLAYVVGELEQRGYGHLAYCYYAMAVDDGFTKPSIFTCWGLPWVALGRVSGHGANIRRREIEQSMARLP